MKPENHPAKLLPAKGFTQLHVETLGILKRHGCDTFVTAATTKWIAEELIFRRLLPGSRYQGPLKCGLLKLQKYGFIRFTGIEQYACYLTDRPLLVGICRECGCTELCGCEEGCGWTDETKTICTECQKNSPLNPPSEVGGKRNR